VATLRRGLVFSADAGTLPNSQQIIHLKANECDFPVSQSYINLPEASWLTDQDGHTAAEGMALARHQFGGASA
jgi:hypothetical protein